MAFFGADESALISAEVSLIGPRPAAGEQNELVNPPVVTHPDAPRSIATHAIPASTLMTSVLSGST